MCFFVTDNFLLFPPEKVPAKYPSNFNKSISSSFFWTSSALLFEGIPFIAAYKFKCSLAVRFSNKASN